MQCVSVGVGASVKHKDARLIGMGSTLDLGPVHVRGALRARYARVIYQDGTLYVVHRRGRDIRRETVQTSEPVPPENRDGYWHIQTDDGQKITASRKGCSG